MNNASEHAGSASTTPLRPPKTALILGWAGVVPFWGLALASALRWNLPLIADERAALVGYGAIILSFMAGVQWGLAMRAPDAPDGPATQRLLMLSVLPAIAAWFTLLATPAAALIILAGLFVALLTVDFRVIAQGMAPSWYRSLRIQLTAAVILALAVAVIAG